MKIGLDRKKYQKRMMFFLFVSITFSIAFTMTLTINVLKNNHFGFEKIMILTFLFLMLTFSIYLLQFYYKLRKIKDSIITIQNGELTDYSKPFNRAYSLEINNITSFSYWKTTGGIKQLKLTTKNSSPKLKGFLNQLKGNDFYINDYLVATEDLLSLMDEINRLKSSNQQTLDPKSKNHPI